MSWGASDMAPAQRDGAPQRGVFFLVAGPSGVGKDALIDQVRRRRPDIAFPTRVITRPADAGGEAHREVSDEEFTRLEASGGFALSWRAHGVAYGVPASAAEALSRGRSALVNVSRGVVSDARRRFAPIRVLLVTAPAEALAQRLAARGRESVEEIAARLARASATAPTGPDVSVIDNGGALEDGVAAMLSAIDAAIGPTPGRDRADASLTPSNDNDRGA